MTHPALTHQLSQVRVAELRRRGVPQQHTIPPEPQMADTSQMIQTVPVTIRFAGSHDQARLAMLAQLDSAARLTQPALVAEIDGQLRAALSLVDAAVIADPFHPTLELVELLRTRAQQLIEEPRSGLLARLRVRGRAAGAPALGWRD
jgi:hypothetical protein